MNLKQRKTSWTGWLALLALLLAFPNPRSAGAASTSSTPAAANTSVAIVAIYLDGKEVVVEAEVSAGVRSLVLEFKPRLGTATWEPRAVERLQTPSIARQLVKFRLPRTAEMELLRVRAMTEETLPAAFFDGPRSFGLPVSSNPDFRTIDFVTAVGAEDNKSAAPPQSSASSSSNREVVESDIWRVAGDTLYFFNQFRGLQVIDVSNPDAATLKGTYPLAAAGEQMYLFDDSHVILLARDRCSGYGASSESQVLLLELNNGQPSLVGQLAVPGQIRESRLVGTALYVVAERYRPVPRPSSPDPLKPEEEGFVAEWGSEVVSFDLSRFSQPVEKSRQWVPGFGNAITATDRFLFVATPQQNSRHWNANSEIQIFDISAPDGTMVARSTLALRGRVKDKFKMNLKGEVFTAVTETNDRILRTQVETFSLADPAAPKPLGYLSIIERERLFATRFAGDLLYAVTFLQVDPLWIIDLTDPAQPKKRGELEIPGWSTHIHPLDGRLVTVGIDNTDGWRTSVQLFDVEDLDNPTLLSKVVLGERFSSSEANQDEKAFGVLPEEKLVLVPYSSYTEQGSVQAMQLIDLERDTLRQRGTIDHQFQARRATVHRNRILSLSGVELFSVDASNRDKPRVVSRTELSWAADRVFLLGENLVELSTPWNSAPSIRVVKADDLLQVQSTLEMANLPLLGAAVRDSRLYVAQGKSTEVIWPRIWNPTNYFPISTNKASLKVSVYDLSQLPKLQRVAEVETEFENKYWSNLEAIWPRPNTLVWAAQAQFYGILPFHDAVTKPVGIPFAPAIEPGRLIRPWWGNQESYFLAYDVSQPAQVRFLSEVSLRGEKQAWNFSKAHSVDGLVYLSHQENQFDKEVQPPPVITRKTNGKETVIVTNIPPPGAWVQRYFLNVINYANPAEPTVREPVNIPGALIGVSSNGQLLYTQSPRYEDKEQWADYREWIDAVAYDGVDAFLVDSMPLPSQWPRPVMTRAGALYLGKVAEDKQRTAALEVWTLSEAGKFAKLSAIPMSSPAQNLHFFGDLLAATTESGVQLLDASSPYTLSLRGGGGPEGCLGFNLEFADGNLRQGLWLPLGSYGVTKVGVKP